MLVNSQCAKNYHQSLLIRRWRKYMYLGITGIGFARTVAFLWICNVYTKPNLTQRFGYYLILFHINSVQHFMRGIEGMYWIYQCILLIDKYIFWLIKTEGYKTIYSSTFQHSDLQIIYIFGIIIMSQECYWLVCIFSFYIYFKFSQARNYSYFGF